MNKLYTLVKRECWEHKWRLFLLPIYTALIFLVLFYLDVAFNWHNLNEFKMTATKSGVDITTAGLHPLGIVILTQFAAIPLVLLGLYLFVNYIFYPLQTLFQDRKDGSIAFFRSMPYSEGMELASKLITILLVAPIFYWAVGTVMWHLTMPTLNHFIPKDFDQSNFTIASSIVNKSFAKMFLLEFWFLPYIAYLFVCSAFAKRSPFFLAVTPLFVIVAVERIIFGTHHIFHWLNTPIKYYYEAIKTDNSASSWGISLHNPAFWYGILIAVVLFAGAAVLRKRNASNI